jgi:hypothetical protein
MMNSTKSVTIPINAVQKQMSPSSPPVVLKPSTTAVDPSTSKPPPVEVTSTTTASIPTSQKLPLPSEVRIQILNGSGVKGLADRVRTVMKDRGYMVKSYSNAERQDYKLTQIVVRISGTQGELAGKLVAQSLGVTPNNILIAPDPLLREIDVTLIMGKDYRKLNLSLE